MKKLTVITSALMILMGSGIVEAQDTQTVVTATAEKTVKKQTVCPIMGGEVDTAIYADANGKRVYFCCKGCIAEFKKDPAKHIDKLEKSGVTLDKTPVADQTKKEAPADAKASPKADCHSAKKGGGGCNM
jgi:YHS domain-containing protein